MHRHGYKGRKFGRENDQRRALLKGLAANLIEHEEIVTTLPKAKELVPYVEKLITKAKIGDLHNRRQIISKVAHVDAAHKLVDELAPKLTGRDSGHLSIKRDGYRRGDNSTMARVSFVGLTVTYEAKKEVKKTEPTAEEKKAAKVAKKATVTAKKPELKGTKVVAKRTGVRGNK
jgi:large subunit ribosomal protein L17